MGMPSEAGPELLARESLLCILSERKIERPVQNLTGELRLVGKRASVGGSYSFRLYSASFE